MKRHIGLVTDFGDGPYQGIMKAVIASIDPELKVIDLDHWVPSFSVTAGAYIVANSYHWMPRGSVIVAVIDPGVGFSRAALAVETSNYVFIGPDNGVLYPAIIRDGFKRAVAIDYRRIEDLVPLKFRGVLQEGRWVISHTFHGRDVFAPAAALIASGAVDLEDLGRPVSLERLRKASIDHVEHVNGYYRVNVVYIDKFGNVALSAKPQMVPLRKWSVVGVKTHAGMFYARVVNTFSEAPGSDLIIYVNSFGYLELAVNRGNAAHKIGAEIDMKITLVPMEERGARRGGTVEAGEEALLM